MVGTELEYLLVCNEQRQTVRRRRFTRRCQRWLEQHSKRGGVADALLHNTASLEIAALLLDIQPGDEVIMPSFTFVSTANAFVLRGARKVCLSIFVRIR